MSCQAIGTPEEYAAFTKALAQLKASGGSKIMALQAAQEVYKYLPRDIIELIAKELNTTVGELYGIATFYSQFSLIPIGKYKISVCMGTACYVKGAGDVLQKVKDALNIDAGGTTEDGLFSIEASRCVGCCGLAPIMSVNDDIYGRIHAAEVDGIITKYRTQG